MESYMAAKARVFANQTSDDFLVYHLDDPLVAQLVRPAAARLFTFSRMRSESTGIFSEAGRIVVHDAGRGHVVEDLLGVDELQIPGAHNLENALAAAGAAWCADVGQEAIVRALRRFKGVEHRMELVASVGGVKFINDSKGTNPDASIKAVEAADPMIFLIAGGYEKQADFRPFIRRFGGKVAHLLLVGATKERFAAEAMEVGFGNCTLCEDMGACVRLGYELAQPGDTVLLSPASASWDMYKDYEERGEHFKSLVRDLAEHSHEKE
jgi:UDP-N-acetylmuramoylalanine--D-glutamate ligase